MIPPVLSNREDDSNVGGRREERRQDQPKYGPKAKAGGPTIRPIAINKQRRGNLVIPACLG